MSKWRAQGLATLAWAGAVLVFGALWNATAKGGWIDPGLTFAFMYLGMVASVIVIATSVVLLVWRNAGARTVMWIHLAIGVALAIAVRVAK